MYIISGGGFLWAEVMCRGCVCVCIDQLSARTRFWPGESDAIPYVFLSKQLGLEFNTIIHGYRNCWVKTVDANHVLKSGYFWLSIAVRRKPAPFTDGRSIKNVKSVTATKRAVVFACSRGALVDQSDTFFKRHGSPREVQFFTCVGQGSFNGAWVVSDYFKRTGYQRHASQLWLGHSPWANVTQSVQTLETQRGWCGFSIDAVRSKNHHLINKA